jgi:murein DD-endopeptidase MepM/ murein hydrolase activator NlpD
VFQRADPEQLLKRKDFNCGAILPRAAALCAAVIVAGCVNLHAPGEETSRRLPPVVVSRADDGAAIPLDMRPMLASDSAYFRSHPLMVPVEGVDPSELTDTYHAARSGGRIHMATDIMAMRGTPVLAAASGRIIRLGNSGAGGIGLYIADAGGRYVEYYAHLMGYAPNVKEGLRVEQGDVIAFVGSTGNASPDAPHLHFQVMRGDANYWNGSPIDVRSFVTKPGRMRN